MLISRNNSDMCVCAATKESKVVKARDTCNSLRWNRLVNDSRERPQVIVKNYLGILR